MNDHQDNAGRGREVAQKAGELVSYKMGDLCLTFLVRVIVALLLGIAALFWQSDSIAWLLRLFGLFLVFDAAMTFFGLRRIDGQQGAAGVLAGIVGLALLVIPNASARLAFILVGVWALLNAAGYFIAWWKMPDGDPEKQTSRNVGILALVGGLVLVLWPATGMVALGWMLAILALVAAAILFYLAARFKTVKQRVSTLRQ
mgnify:CR=1 FL=1